MQFMSVWCITGCAIISMLLLAEIGAVVLSHTVNLDDLKYL